MLPMEEFRLRRIQYVHVHNLQLKDEESGAYRIHKIDFKFCKQFLVVKPLLQIVCLWGTSLVKWLRQ